ncbi:MAG: hypothetical protein EXR99_05245 [Gemmataceae bacterium]|nr:hypothetical protein [Gemmataceae bacterium]
MKPLPLLVFTPTAWAKAALASPVDLLNDHAYLEKKAAANALELLNRWPEPQYPRKWLSTLAGIARDESAHLVMVIRFLAKFGGKLSRTHFNPYASTLHKLVRKGQGTLELMDRLLIASLIEARSCERFELLAKPAQENELSKLYSGLAKSERNHYLVFLNLAKLVRQENEVLERWQELLREEATIIQAQPLGPRMHSGWK